MLACDRIRILAVFSSGKIMAKWRNSRVLSAGYTCYENLQSSCRVDLCASVFVAGWCSRVTCRVHRDTEKDMKKKIPVLTLCATLFALCFSAQAQALALLT